MAAPNSSPGVKSPTEPRGTDKAPLLPLIETDGLGTETRIMGLSGISLVTTGQSLAMWHGTAVLSLPETRGLSQDPTYAPQICQCLRE